MFLRWLNDKAVALVDPGKEQRRDTLAAALYQSLSREKGRSSSAASRVLPSALIQMMPTTWPNGSTAASCIQAGRTDNSKTQKNARSTGLRKSFRSRRTPREINLDYAKRAFEQVLSEAMEDGCVDEQEAAAMEQIAAEWEAR